MTANLVMFKRIFIILIWLLESSISFCQESSCFYKLYGSGKLALKAECVCKSKNGEKCVELSFFSPSQTSRLSIEMDYPDGFKKYYEFLSNVEKKAREWKNVAKQNNVKELNKDIPVATKPVARTGICSKSIPVAMSFTSPQMVSFSVVDGYQSSYISLGYGIQDDLFPSQSNVFLVYLSVDDFSDLIRNIQPEIIDYYMIKSVKKSNVENLFK